MRLWYAFMIDEEDDDWGIGTYDRDEAIAWLTRCRYKGATSAYLAVIDSAETHHALCVDVIHIVDVINIYDL